MTTPTSPIQDTAVLGRSAPVRHSTTSTHLLEVTDLKVQFPTADGLVSAVSGMSYSVDLGKTMAIVGESGSGKSVSSLAVLGLHNPKRTLMSGSIKLDGTEIIGLSLSLIHI